MARGQRLLVLFYIQNIHSMKAIHIIFVIGLSLIIRCGYSQYPPSLEIEYGTATFKGSVEGFVPQDINVAELNMVITDALTYFKEISIPIDEHGQFMVQIPSFGLTHGFINSTFYTGNIFLLPNEETQLRVFFDDTGQKHIDVTEKLGITKDDLMKMGFVLGEILADDQKIDSSFGLIEDGEDFIKYSSLYMQISHDQIAGRDDISKMAQMVLQKGITTFLFRQLFLDYYRSMRASYHDRYNQENEASFSEMEYEAPKIDSTYFNFLADYDMNSATYLLSSYLQPFLQDLLKDETLNIPGITNYTVDNWVTILKNKLGHAIGTDNGLFYDLLTANAYIRQLTDLRLLTDSQKNDIRAHFTNKAFTDFLLDENERIRHLVAQNRSSETLVIHETPDVPNEQLLDAIIEKYSGQVVFVDFWATWCAPCLQGMRESAPLKKELGEANVAFVYITTTSSPPKIWEDKIKDIGGNHYYLAREQWEYLLGKLDFSEIPTYLIYDKQGNRKHKHTMFMGVENMRNWIHALL